MAKNQAGNEIPPESLRALPRQVLAIALRTMGEDLCNCVACDRYLQRIGPNRKADNCGTQFLVRDIKDALDALPRKYRGWALEWLRYGTAAYHSSNKRYPSAK